MKRHKRIRIRLHFHPLPTDRTQFYDVNSVPVLQATIPKTVTMTAIASRIGEYDENDAADFAKITGATADANTVSICAAPWIRPNCAGPNTARHTAKKSTVTIPPEMPIIAANAHNCAMVFTNGNTHRAAA